MPLPTLSAMYMYLYFFFGIFPFPMCFSHCIENMAAEWEKSNSTKSIKYSGKNMAQAENSLHTSSTSSGSRSSFMLHSHLYNDSRSGKNRGGNNMNTRRHVYKHIVFAYAEHPTLNTKTYNSLFWKLCRYCRSSVLCSQNCPQLLMASHTA